MNAMPEEIPAQMGVPQAVEVEAIAAAPTEDELLAMKQAEDARIARLDAFGQHLSRLRDEAIRYRSDFEQEWVEAHFQYDEGEVANAGQRGTRDFPADSGTPDYRKTRDNITRPAVLLVTSRISDMLFPTSDRNWDLTPSPDATVPQTILMQEIGRILEQEAKDVEVQQQLAQQQQDPNNPQPPQPPPELPDPQSFWDSKGFEERESIEQQVAERRALRMRTRIDDQLQESCYAAHARDCIGDGALYGTGVLKGPFGKVRRVRMYNEETGRWEAQYQQTPTPATCYVDLFNFYPLPARRISECPGAFELHLLTNEALRKLVDQPGFDRKQIARAVKEEGRTVGLLSSSILYRIGVTSRSGTTASLLDNRNAVWEFHGSAPKQAIVDFTASLLQQEAIDAELASAIIAEVQDDPMLEMFCECWVVNGIVIKLALEPVREITAMYHVYNYEERPDTLFGKGVPMILRDDQLATTQLWQAMMLNAMMSAGLQIGVKKGSLEPMGPGGGAYDLTCTRPRVWAFNDGTEDIRKAFQAFEVPSVLDKLMPLYERSKKNSEEHIVLPSLVQGDPTNAVPTSSGLAMLMNAGNIVTRRLAKGWDDNITTPLIGGFFEWNMDNGPDDVKGDYTVIPRGSSHLLVKDVQSQRFLFALQTYSVTPQLESQMKWHEWGRQGLTIMDLDASRLLYSEEEQRDREREAMLNPPAPDPQTMVAQARVKEAEARSTAAASTIELNNLRLQSEQEKVADDIAFRREELASRMEIAQLTYLAKLADLDAKERKEMAKLENDMRKEGMWARIDAAKMEQQRERDALQVQVESPNPRLA